MKRRTRVVIGSVSIAALALAGGCARPISEFGYTVALTSEERGREIARNWDYEGKQAMDDIDSLLLLRPHSNLTPYTIP